MGQGDAVVGKTVDAHTGQGTSTKVVIQGVTQTIFSGLTGRVFSFAASKGTPVGILGGFAPVTEERTKERRGSNPLVTSVGCGGMYRMRTSSSGSTYFAIDLPTVCDALSPNVIGMGLDDSLGQRTILDRIFKEIGCKEDNLETYGSSSADIDELRARRCEEDGHPLFQG